MFVVGLRSHQDPAMRCVASLLLKLAGGNFSNLQLASWVRWPPSLCSKLATDGVDLALSSEIVSRGGGVSKANGIKINRSLNIWM